MQGRYIIIVVDETRNRFLDLSLLGDTESG